MINLFFAILVWIADHTIIMMVLGAAIALLLKIENRIPKRFERWLFIADVIFIASSLLLGALKDHLDAAWQQSMEVKVSESRKLAEDAFVKMRAALQNADEANAKVGAISKEVAVERARYAELEKRASQLEEASKDRAISISDRAKFIVAVSHLPKCKISIRYLMDSKGEPHRFAEQLATLVDESGFHLDKEAMRAFMTTGEVAGIMLKVKSATTPPKGAAVLQKAFGVISIIAPASIEDAAFPIEDDEVRLYVYKK